MTANPVSASAAAHIRAMQATAGVSVQYVRSGTSTDLVAVPGRTNYAPKGAMAELFAVTKPRDWIVRVSDLPATPPAAGDYIDHDSHHWEILPVGAYRWWSPHDSAGLAYRLHTLYVDFRDSVTLQKWTESGTDGHGQSVGSWGDEQTGIPAAVVPVAENNAEIARALWETASHRIFVRKPTAYDFTSTKRLTYNARTLTINDVQNIDEEGLFLVLTCTEDLA